MFSRGISDLLDALPTLPGLEETTVRRMLSAAYLDVLDRRDEMGRGTGPPSDEVVPYLRRLATALELHAVLAPDLATPARRGSAFVAAEALGLLVDLGRTEPTAYEDAEGPPRWRPFGSIDRYERVESGLLFVIAGFDANAAISARNIPEMNAGAGAPLDEIEREWQEYALRAAQRLLTLGALPTPPAPTAALDALDDHVLEIRSRAWGRLGDLTLAHVAWVRYDDDAPESSAVPELRRLADLLGGEEASAYADLAHFSQLLATAAEETEDRALRRVPPPPDDDGRYGAYVRSRASERGLLWPSAEPYVDACLPGPHRHAAVAVPTGSGKSFIAELAISHAVGDSWVLYLAPTNALVGQIRRDLRHDLASFPEIEVRAFLGGSEYLELADESVESVEPGTVLVMTPEKCSLALRQSPEAFEELGLCVFDECHLIGDIGGRGALAELVAAHVLAAAPQVRFLMLSALVQNPEDLRDWLADATGISAQAVRVPWRPTRTLRAVLGFDEARASAPMEEAIASLAALGTNRVNYEFDAPLALLANLQGPWADVDSTNYSFVELPQTAPLKVTRGSGGISLNASGYLNRTVAKVAEALAASGERVLAFVPKNRHHSFGVAERLAPNDAPNAFGDEPVRRLVEAYLEIAKYELGLASRLSDLIERGVTVHTSALLPSERRASEIAYDAGVARVMIATGTLAQGLNLPATAVLIGGTEIGFQPRLSAAQRRQRATTQLLNAIGRAGRPGVSNRSIAIVIPNRPIGLAAAATPTAALSKAPFLRHEDASTELKSQLDPLIEQALGGELTIAAMTPEEMAAFTYLPLSEGPENEQAAEILRRTYGAWRREVTSGTELAQLSSTLGALGRAFMQEAEAPGWLAEVSYRTGLSLPQVFALHTAIRELQLEERPTSYVEWMRFTVELLKRISPVFVAEMLDQEDFPDGFAFDAIWNPEAPDFDAAWTHFADTVAAFMQGETIDQLGQRAMPNSQPGDDRRTAGNLPIPKLLTFVQQILAFQFSRVAGGVVALFLTGAEQTDEVLWQLHDASRRPLEGFPLAIHYGCDDASSLAWFRFGVRHRRPAHLIAGLLPLPTTATTEQQQAAWVRDRYTAWLEQAAGTETQEAALDADERAVLAAIRRLAATEN